MSWRRSIKNVSLGFCRFVVKLIWLVKHPRMKNTKMKGIWKVFFLSLKKMSSILWGVKGAIFSLMPPISLSWNGITEQSIRWEQKKCLFPFLLEWMHFYICEIQIEVNGEPDPKIKSLVSTNFDSVLCCNHWGKHAKEMMKLSHFFNIQNQSNFWGFKKKTLGIKIAKCEVIVFHIHLNLY